MNYMNGQLQPAPLQPQAEQMSQYGRYGDNTMVHMNPLEVEAMSSMVPGGLTTNPVTGQPEAFAFLIPMLASMFAPAGFTAAAGAIGTGAAASSFAAGASGVLGAIGANSALASGIASGLATTAVTGDLKKGLASGITSFGLGSVLGGGADVGTGAAETSKTLAEAGVIAGDAGVAAGIAEGALKSIPEGLDAAALDALKGTATETAKAAGTADSVFKSLQDKMFTQRTGLENIDGVLTKTASAPSFLERVAQPFSSKDALTATGKGLASKSAILPIAIGGGLQGQIEMEEGYEQMYRDREADKKAELDNAYGLLGESLAYAGDDFDMDVSGAGSQYAAYDPSQYANGGIVSLNPQEYQRQLGALQTLGMRDGRQVPIRMYPGGRFDVNTGSGINFGPAVAAGRQSQLRGPVTKSAEELADVGYRPGFGPEIEYFRQKTDAEIEAGKPKTTPVVTDSKPEYNPNSEVFDTSIVGGEGGGYGGFVGVAQDRARQQYLAEQKQNEEFFSGQGSATTRTSTSDEDKEYEPMDYADVYSIGMKEGKTVPSADPLIEQTMMAVMGRLDEEESSIVIDRFIDEYGNEAFQMLREGVLQKIQPNSQTEGVISGPGRGMDDMVPGTIGDQQRVAVSPGEYIIPADVVSAAGDGDTTSGAARFDAMLNEIRTEKTGTTKQPAPLTARVGGLLPA